MYEMERMKYISKFYRVTCFLLICVFLMFTGNGEAKQKIGELQQSDFGYNGVCLLDTENGKCETIVERTAIHFVELSDETIEAYLLK